MRETKKNAEVGLEVEEHTTKVSNREVKSQEERQEMRTNEGGVMDFTYCIVVVGLFV